MMTDNRVPTDKAALKKLLAIVENDLDALGWDQPTRLYVLVGRPDDPRLEAVGPGIKAHPCDMMQALYDRGMRFHREVMGLVLATEAWRHLDFEEAQEVDPRFTQVMEAACRLKELSEDEVQETVRNAYYKAIEQFAPRDAPDRFRRELRTVQAVFRDGAVALAVRERAWRGHESTVDFAGFDEDESVATQTGRVATFMHQWLNDARPEDHPGQNLMED